VFGRAEDIAVPEQPFDAIQIGGDLIEVQV